MYNFRIKFEKKLTLVFSLGLVVAFLLTGCATQPSGSKAGVSDVDPSKSLEITSIEVSEGDDSVDVTISGRDRLTYTSVKQPAPLGVILYFPNTRLNADNTDIPSSGNPVASVKAGQIESNHKTTRIEILLSSDVPYNVVEDGTSLNIKFSKPGAMASQPVMQKESAAPAAVAQTTGMAQPAKPSGAFQGTGVAVENDGQIWVNRIDFLGEANGRSTLSIETTSEVEYNIKKISEKLLELRLMNANIAEFRQRPLITTRFESAINRIMPVQLPSMKDFSLFSIELREPVPYYTEQVGTLLLVHFEASSVPPAPVDETNLPSWKKALAETLGPADVMSTYDSMSQTGNDVQSTDGPSAGPQAGQPVGAQGANMVLDADQAMVVTKKARKYTGEKIALDFFQTDIKNVFRILREVSGKNFAIDKDVNGKVTLTLDKPVPWDQVMDLVLRMNQLGMVVEGDIIRIATLATLKQENDLRKAQIAALQKEKEQIKALEPLETRYIPISYSDAETEVLPHIENIITEGRGTVTVDSKNNQIILTDTAAVIAQAREITRQIDKVTSQVVIEARIVEVEEEFVKELGFSWAADVGPIGINGGKLAAGGNTIMNFPAALDTTGGVVGFTLERILNTPFSLDMQLSALETSQKLKVLSAPKIVTLNNKKAMIKQGQEIGYLERDSSGGATIKFKEVDLLLEVTPHVTPDNRISLTIVLTKDEVTGFIETVPLIDTNEANTQLLVNDGDTIVIGGIIKNKDQRDKENFPGLHKIPVLGWMFKSHRDEVLNKELLIFLNPKIVQLEQRANVY
jgi:type IV pilus assembly protein PilQ